jgi:hypothetical protein
MLEEALASGTVAAGDVPLISVPSMVRVVVLQVH